MKRIKKLSMLAISSLLLVSTAFAVEKQETESPTGEKQPPTATVQVAGKTIATLQMVDDVVLSFETQADKKAELVYDPANDMITYKGKCKLEAWQGDKRLLQLVVDDGVVTFGPLKEMPKIIEMLKTKAEK